MSRAMIIGLGREGLALARYLRERGDDVTVAEGHGIAALGPDVERLAAIGARLIAGNDHPDLGGIDVLYLNPAVSKEAPVVRDARARGLPVSALTDLFFAVCPAHIAGVTGSNGKTTTTTLLGRMVAAAGISVEVGGNIGRPLLNEAAAMQPGDWVVLEMSSFQLEWLRASPEIAVITNLTPNHLDRHHTMEEYAMAKAPIVRYQRPGDLAVLNLDDPYAPWFAAQASGRVHHFSITTLPEHGAGLDGDRLTIRRDGRGETVCVSGDLRVPGRHNVANALAAIAAADRIGVGAAAMREAIRGFTGVAHRLELVRVRDGARYYNDSIATSPDRAAAALDAIADPILLILGGHDKDLPWEALCRQAVRRCRAALLIGEAQDLIADQLGKALREMPDGLLRPEAVLRCGDLERAVAAAAGRAQEGDVVLLSPGCASYDQFRNFEERGCRYRALVEGLA